MPVAVRNTVDPIVNAPTHGPGLEQLNPDGLLVTIPEPSIISVSAFVVLPPPPPPPEPEKQTTLAVIYPVMIAPEADRPWESLLVLAVAETNVLPHCSPVAVSKPVELTVNICGVFEDHVTWFVMSFVTGGWT